MNKKKKKQKASSHKRRTPEPQILPHVPVLPLSGRSFLQHSLGPECVHIHRAPIVSSNQGEVITVDKGKTNIFPTVNPAGYQITCEVTLHRREAKSIEIKYISKGIGQHEHNCTGNKGKQKYVTAGNNKGRTNNVIFSWTRKCLL